MNAGILTISDKASKGEREDKSGKAIQEILSQAGFEIAEYQIVPDEPELIKKYLIEWSDKNIDLIITTGGTGFAPRDQTPEATKEVIEREAPGISEAIRFYGLQKTPRAMLSRGVAGIRKSSLIINLPGSEKAVRESLSAILPALEHGIEILKEITKECAHK